MKKLIAILLLSVAVSSLAVDRVDVSSAFIHSDTWQLDGLQAAVEINEKGQLQLILQAAQAAFAGHQLTDIKLSCVDFKYQADVVECPHGHVTFSGFGLKQAATPLSFSYHKTTKKILLSANELALANGTISFDFVQQENNWTVRAHVSRISLARLLPLLEQFDIKLPKLGYQGTLKGSLSLQGQQSVVRLVEWDMAANALAYANEAGTQAGEKLRLSSQGKARLQGKDWRAEIELIAASGMLFSDPLYFEYKPGYSQTLNAQLHWYSEANIIDVERIDINHAQVLEGAMKLRLKLADKATLTALEIAIKRAWLPAFYKNYLQPWFAGTVWDDIDTRGELSGSMIWKPSGLDTLNLSLKNATVNERSGLFGIAGLNADVQWDVRDSPQQSTLTWQAANVRQLKLGKARLQMTSRGRKAHMTDALSIDLLDGRLHMGEFNIDWSGDNGVNWQFDAVLSPISMPALSAAVGWPELAGSLSGVIPNVVYKNGELNLGGTLLVQLFDGDVTLRHLKIQEPLGLAPRLWADIRLAHLDLDTLTRTFSFGRIEGKLQGEVNGLYMEAWQPVAFDAHFETPPGDKSRHRISQKAVDSISNLGGSGVSGALSRGFLRFLEDFPYQRLGIRCRLERGVCHMDGVAPAPNGYYLVQGRLIPPRLDMIGHEHRVDWQSLVERLVAVTQQPTAIVE